MILCTYEDRPTDLTALKLLVLSLARHCPDLRIQVTCPVATPAFTAWMARQPNADLFHRPSLRGRGFNVKPLLLLEALAHDPEATWIDADIIVRSDFRALWPDLPPRAVGATQEFYWGAHQGGTQRTAAWGLDVGRVLPCTVNSCVVRVTHEHRTLLRRWIELLHSPAYRAAQQQPWTRRPVHLLGDQEVLTALLGSREFADVPIRLLRRGAEIVQNGGAAGYTVAERLANVLSGRGLPPLIHAQGRKPWNPAPWHERMHLQLSPYTAEARAYRELLDEDVGWMDVATLPGRVCRLLTGGEPSLQALPMALVDGWARRVKRALRRSAWPAEASGSQSTQRMESAAENRRAA